MDEHVESKKEPKKSCTVDSASFIDSARKEEHVFSSVSCSVINRIFIEPGVTVERKRERERESSSSSSGAVLLSETFQSGTSIDKKTKLAGS